MRCASTLVVLISLISHSQAAGDVCYGANGNQDPTLAVCDPSASVSSCCQLGDYCYSNGLCESQSAANGTSTSYTTYGVRGCTDPQSKTGECLPFARCSSLGVGVTSCGGTSYCCYGLGGCDCNNSTQVFNLGVGTIITSLPLSIMASTSSATQLSSSATSSSSSKSTASSSSVPATSNNSVAIGVGIGVGVGVAVLLAAGLGLFFWRKRRQNTGSRLVSKDENGYTYTADAKHGSVESPPDYMAAAHHQPRDQGYTDEIHDQSGATYNASEMDATHPVAQLDDTAPTKRSAQQSSLSELA